MAMLVIFLVAAMFLPVVAVILLPLLLVVPLLVENKQPAAPDQVSRNDEASQSNYDEEPALAAMR